MPVFDLTSTDLHTYSQTAEKRGWDTYPTNIILCNDPGIDDVIAMMLLHSPKLDINIHAIIAGAGNVPADITSRRAWETLQLMGVDDSILYKGKEVDGIEDNAMGAGGLGRVTIRPKKEQPILPSDYISRTLDTIRNLPDGERMTLVSTGGLTDIAEILKAIKQHGLSDRISHVALMGGVLNQTEANAPPGPDGYTEFNLLHAADASADTYALCAEMGIDIVQATLDMTHHITLSQQEIDALESVRKPGQNHANPQNPVAEVCRWLLASVPEWDFYRYNEFTDTTIGGKAGLLAEGYSEYPQHDPAIILALLYPGLFDVQENTLRVHPAGHAKAGGFYDGESSPEEGRVYTLYPAERYRENIMQHDEAAGRWLSFITPLFAKMKGLLSAFEGHCADSAEVDATYHYKLNEPTMGRGGMRMTHFDSIATEILPLEPTYRAVDGSLTEVAIGQSLSGGKGYINA